MRLSAGGAALVAISVAFGTPAGTPAFAAVDAVQAGMLTCDVASGWGFVFGSSKNLKCTYSRGKNAVEHYTGSIGKFGVDIGYSGASVIAWTVLAPTSDLAPGSLAGKYAGATGSAAVGGGVGANVLVGGGNNSISLQPVSFQAGTGLNVAGGIAMITLKHAK